MVSESGLRGYILCKRIWFSSSNGVDVSDRNSQITADIVVDLFFLIFPVAIMFLQYGIKINPAETLSIIIAPCVSLFSKLRTVLLETFALNLDIAIVKMQHDLSKQVKRRRESIFVTNRYP